VLPVIAPLAQQFGVNNFLFEGTFKDIGDDELLTRLIDKGNSIQFIAGHVTASRFVLANTIGIEDKCPWGKTFARGAEVKDASEYPSIDEIRLTWQSITHKLMARLEELTEDDISKKVTAKYPVSDDTILGAILFLSLHESYHMGQFSYARKLLGKDGLVG
jgi:hypothetical protein